ncbi:MAG: hypothetical protein ISS70_11225 [Phycisphaerae bacterium]|nr:hypothetical protein [Phycisphaerae bacterium]
MKQASIIFLAAAFLFVVNVEQCGGIPQVPAGYQKYKPYYVLQAQYEAEKKLAPANMVPLVDIEKHPNDVHFNTAGQLKTGRLFAEGYLELVKETDQK